MVISRLVTLSVPLKQANVIVLSAAFGLVKLTIWKYIFIVDAPEKQSVEIQHIFFFFFFFFYCNLLHVSEVLVVKMFTITNNYKSVCVF